MAGEWYFECSETIEIKNNGCQEKILDNPFFIRYDSKGDKNG